MLDRVSRSRGPILSVYAIIAGSSVRGVLFFFLPGYPKTDRLGTGGSGVVEFCGPRPSVAASRANPGEIGRRGPRGQRGRRASCPRAARQRRDVTTARPGRGRSARRAAPSSRPRRRGRRTVTRPPVTNARGGCGLSRTRHYNNDVLMTCGIMIILSLRPPRRLRVVVPHCHHPRPVRPFVRPTGKRKNGRAPGVTVSWAGRLKFAPARYTSRRSTDATAAFRYPRDDDDGLVS